MTFLESQKYLCNKLNVSYDDVNAGTHALFSIQDIKDYLNNGCKRAWDYKPWTFTEKTYKFTLTSGMLTAGYVDYPNNFEDESTYRLEIPVANYGEFTKKDFADYQKWFNDYPTDTSKLWSEHERFIFINMNAVSAGLEVDISGKLRAPTLSADADLLPFSPYDDNDENSGNQAVVLLAYADALSSEKKKNPTQAALEEKRALGILDNVWKPIGERRAQKTSQNRPFFQTQDYFSGRATKNNTNIGNFP